MEAKLRKPPPMERRPTMLKDFLRDDLSSCSSSGFRSFPRRSCYSSVRNLVEMDVKGRQSRSSEKLEKTRSKKAAAVNTTISAFQAVINVVKHFQFPSPSKQRILPRNLSRRLKRSFTKRNDKDKREIRVVVKVKDMMKWKSFRDLVEQKGVNVSLSSPMHTVTTTTTTNTERNSWSDSDFTSECLRSSSGSSECFGENETEDCKKYLPGKKRTITNKVVEDSIDKGESRDDDKDQFSPVSVLDFSFEEDEDSSSSSFNSSLENMARTKRKLMQKIRRFENLAKLEPVHIENRILSLELDDLLACQSDSYSNSVNNDVEVGQESDEEYIKAEEHARELVYFIKQNSSQETCKGTIDRLVVDFFRDAIMERNRNKQMKNCNDNELLKVVTDWMNGKNGLLDWGMEESRQVFYKEIEKGGLWSKLDEQKSETALELEVGVLNSLMDELFFDLLC